MQTPEWATKLCKRFGTVGATPRFRVIWAPDRLEQCFGKTIQAYPHIGGRWIVEALVPWERFGPWNYEAFGPKPPDGEYCHSHTIQQTWEGEVNVFEQHKEQDSKYMSLEDFGAESLRLLLTCIDKGKTISAWQMRNHREQMLEKEEADWKKNFSDMYDDVVGSGLVGGPLGENAVSGIPGKHNSSDQVLVSLDDLSPELQRKLRCRPGSIKQIS